MSELLRETMELREHSGGLCWGDKRFRGAIISRPSDMIATTVAERAWLATNVGLRFLDDPIDSEEFH